MTTYAINNNLNAAQMASPVVQSANRISKYDRALNNWVASDERFKALFQSTNILGNVTPTEAIRAAGGDFTAELWQLGSLTPAGEFKSSGKFNVHRADNGKLLQIGVSGGYSLVKYTDLLVLPDDLEIPVDDANTILANDALRWTAACVWQDGASAHIQYKLNDFEVSQGDRYEVYLTIVGHFDGSGSTKAFLTVTRVVCENTLAHALQDFSKLSQEQKRLLSVRRHANMSDKLDIWRQRIVMAMTDNKRYMETFQRLYSVKLQNAERTMLDALSNVFGLTESLEGSGRGKTQATNRLEELVTNVRFGTGQPGRNPETALELYNGLTFNLSWAQNFKSTKDWSADDLRQKATWSTLIENQGQEQNRALAYVLNLAA